MSIPAGLEPAELAHFAVSALRECLTSLDELGPYCARTTAEGTLKHLVAYEFQLAALDATLLERYTRLCSVSASMSGSQGSVAALVEANGSGSGSGSDSDSESVYGAASDVPAAAFARPSCPCAQQHATVSTGLAFVRLAQSQLSKVRLLCDAYFEKLELSVEGIYRTNTRTTSFALMFSVRVQYGI